MVPERAAPPGHLLVVGNHTAPFAPGSKVFALAEAETAYIGYGTCFVALVIRRREPGPRPLSPTGRGRE